MISREAEKDQPGQRDAQDAFDAAGFHHAGGIRLAAGTAHIVRQTGREGRAEEPEDELPTAAADPQREHERRGDQNDRRGEAAHEIARHEAPEAARGAALLGGDRLGEVGRRAQRSSERPRQAVDLLQVAHVEVRRAASAGRHRQPAIAEQDDHEGKQTAAHQQTDHHLPEQRSDDLAERQGQHGGDGRREPAHHQPRADAPEQAIQALHQDERHRDDQQRQHRRRGEAAHHDSGERRPEFVLAPAFHRQRPQGGDGGGGSHQHWSRALAHRRQGRGARRPAAAHPLLDAVHQQDRRIDGEAEQQQRAGRGIGGEGSAGEQQRPHRAEDGQRQGASSTSTGSVKDSNVMPSTSSSRSTAGSASLRAIDVCSSDSRSSTV